MKEKPTQYLYMALLSFLFLAIIISLPKTCRMRFFKKSNVPLGCILCGLTWGLVHILTQDLLTGIYTTALSVIYGIVYLLLKKMLNMHITFLL